MPIGPDDVGRRVVLRHRLPDGRATDVLGELLGWTLPAEGPDGRVEPGHAVVSTARGPVRVELRDVLLGKVVPSAPVRRPRGVPRLTVSELHAVMADGWQPLERRTTAAGGCGRPTGFTGRANSVLPLGPPPAPLPAAVDHAERWYAARSLPARFCVPWELGSGPGEAGAGDGPIDGPIDDPLDAELARRGYELDTPTLVPGPPDVRAGGRSARRGPVPPASYDVAGAGRAGRRAPRLYRYRGQDLPPVAARVLVSAPAQAFVSVLERGTGRTVAVGRVASSQGWAGVTRGRGGGRPAPSRPRARW